jgi:hypothetical protein
VALPDGAEMTPVDDPSSSDESVEDEEDVEDVEDACDVELLEAVDWLDDADAPGMVTPASVAKTPTPANAPIAVTTVNRFSRRMPSSRASILAWVGCVFSITIRKLEVPC